jgi:hypothetical protein
MKGLEVDAFIGIQFNIDDIMQVTSRTTIDIIGLLGTFGGTWDTLTTVMSVVIAYFGRINYAS